jgi:acyl carrier protein
MEIYDTLRLILNDYISIHDIDKITLQTRLCEDLDFDDYDFIGLSCDIENTFEILLENDLENCRTIQDIINAIKKAKK